MAVPRAPLWMARNVRPAFAASDQGGTVRFAGGGVMPSRRRPRPSAPTPWQMAQLAANRAPPAAWASREAKRPAGALGAPPSHPEMTSKIVNRAIASGRVGFVNHLVAKSLHLTDNGCDKRIEIGVDGVRPDDSKLDCLRH